VSKRITITYETVRERGETVQRATAYVEGQALRTMTSVDTCGDEHEAIAHAARLASRKAQIDEPAAYWPREFEDTHGSHTLLGCKAGR